ncbi:MAG: hypothetical protein R3B57_05000 [Phycisphaerales bacterium]
MPLNDDDRRALGAALATLAKQNPRAFDDALWLSFGDRWWPLRKLLASHGYISLEGPGDGVPALTERGKRLARRFSDSTLSVA